MQGQRVLQDNHIAYDQLGRMTRTADTRYDVSVKYDAAGNREQVHTFYQDAGDEVTDITTVNEFDKMNRQTLVDGDASAAEKLGQQSHRIAYDWAGNRVADTYFATLKPTSPYLQGQKQLTTELYTYDSAGRLADTYRNAYLVDRRYYDAAGRLVRAGGQEVSGNHSWTFRGVVGYSNLLAAGYSTGTLPTVMEALTYQMLSGGAESKLAGVNKMEEFGLSRDFRVNEYDAAGHLKRSKMRDLDNNLSDDIYFEHYTEAGNVASYTVVPAGNRPKTTYNTSYVWYDTAKESTSTASNNGGISFTKSEYDANGFLVKLVDKPAKAAETTRCCAPRFYRIVSQIIIERFWRDH
jgi:hypothetical protein